MKRVVFTTHATARMYERNINGETVRWVIENPDFTISRFDNEVEAFKKTDGKTLKVVYAEKEKYISIITFYWV